MRVDFPEIESKLLRLIGEEADRLGLECYVIGGWVRDLFLKRESKDIDVVVSQAPQSPKGDAEVVEEKKPIIGIDLARAVAKRLKGSHLAVFKTYGTAQVKVPAPRPPKGGVNMRKNNVRPDSWLLSTDSIELEFVGARRESYTRDSRNPIVEDGTLEEDQNRRDFTINALAICLNKDRYGELLDPFGGLNDMEQCIIRTPLDPDITFSDDPLRMMRGIRFASQLGFYLNLTTFEAIERNKERIGIITKERIADELNKIMLSRKPSVGWLLLDKTGLLPLIFPELAALKGVEAKDGRGHKDIFLHTLQVLDNIAQAPQPPEGGVSSEHGTDGGDALEGRFYKQGVGDLKEHMLWLRWAALLHDIGKPRSKRWENGIGWTFHNHNYIGSKMIPKIFAKMKLPQNEKMKYVQKMVDLHMRPINLIEDTVTDSAVRRLLFEAGDDIEDLMLLCDADITSKNEAKVRQYHANYQLVREKMREIEEKDRVRNFQPPIRGEEIMELLSLPPCAEVGRLKNAIKDAILDGIIPNEYGAAKAYLMELWEKTND